MRVFFFLQCFRDGVRFLADPIPWACVAVLGRGLPKPADTDARVTECMHRKLV